jgi:ABC-type Mn2+/Zn2+ transport system ATPase subunit
VLSFDDVSVRYSQQVALAVRSLDLDGGTLVGLIGPNGSGKTTLLALIAGLQTPTTGQLRWESAPRPAVALVGQRHDQATWMPLTAGEVLAIERLRGKGLFRRLNGRDRARLHEVAARLEVTDLLDRPFGTLSFGQRQRVLIAGCVASDAQVLLLDEPITGLDLASQQAILTVVSEERDAGRLVIMSTHHLDEARRCDRVLVLANQIISDGSPTEALRPEALTQAFQGRVLHLDGAPVLLDDHGHDHDHGHAHGHHHGPVPEADHEHI